MQEHKFNSVLPIWPEMLHRDCCGKGDAHQKEFKKKDFNNPIPV